MQASPYKVSQKPIWVTSSISLLYAIYRIVRYTNHETGNIHWIHFLVIFIVFGIGYSLGVLIRNIFFKDLLHTTVKNGVDPDLLDEGQIYYVNGITDAKYIKLDDETGKYIFQIVGTDSDTTFVQRGDVNRYFSRNKEIN